MSRYTGKDCATNSWRLCYRQGRCRQTTARTWSTSSPKPAEYSRRKNKSVNSNIFFSPPQLLTTAMVRYLNERRLNGNEAQTQSHPVTQPHTPSQAAPSNTSPASTSNKRNASSGHTSHDGQTKRPRGRPKGSKNRTKDGSTDHDAPGA
jgi:hypothetical protein